MSKFKLTAIILTVVVVAFYIIYLLILPNFLNLSFLNDMAQTIVKEQLGADIKTGKMKLLTGFPLKAGIQIDDLSLTCSDGKTPVQANTIKAKINIFPLLFKKIQVSNIDIKNVTLNSDISKEGEYSAIKCFVFKENTANTETTPAIALELHEKLPEVNLENVTINLHDIETKNDLALNIDKLNLTNAIFNKHFAISAIGAIELNNNPNITFDIKTHSFMPKFTSNANSSSAQPMPYVNFIKEFAQYNLLANLRADLKISQKNNDIILNGFANVDDLSFKIDGKQLPSSFIHTEFNKKQGTINSQIQISEDENFEFSAILNKSDKLNIEAGFATDKISFVNLQKLAIAALNSMNIKNEVDAYKVNGYISSDLKFQTNSEVLKSSGSLQIANAEFISAKDGLFVKNINSVLDFSNNSLNITNTSASINDAWLEMKGNISHDAVADIEIITQQLPVSKLSSLIFQGELGNIYEIKDGILKLYLALKGKLSEIKPTAKVSLKNLKLLDKVNKMLVSNSDTELTVDTDGKTFQGDLISKDIKVSIPNLSANVPLLKINIEPDKIFLDKTDILLNSSRFVAFGEITNYLKKPQMNISIDGGMVAADIKNFLASSLNFVTQAKGVIPIKIRLFGENDISIKGQIFADSQNNIDVISVKELQNKQSILNADIHFVNDVISVKDIAVYPVNIKEFSDDLPQNISGQKAIFKIYGDVLNYEILKNFKISSMEKIGIKVANVSSDAVLNLDISGNIKSPVLKGNLALSNIKAPDYLISSQLANINIAPNAINADVFGLDLNGSVIDAKIQAANSLALPFVINEANLSANLIDLDKILLITTKFPQPVQTSSSVSTKNMPMIPVWIKKGVAKVGDFKVGTLQASQIKSNFTLKNDMLNLPKFNAVAYDGKLNGDISYDLAKLILTARLNGEGMDANPAVSALIGIKDQIMGILKFDADISMQGATMTEQLKTLKGNANFTIVDGQLGSLGRIETYLKAANIISSKFVQNSISQIINTVLPYNSGQVAKAEGKLTFSGGNAYFSPITSSGKEMALYVDGYLNMLNYNGDIKILGKLNQELVDILGPISNISVDKILSYIPKFGVTAAVLFDSFNVQTDEKELDLIPALTPEAGNKAFKVLIKGNTMSPNAVKSFQWLAKQEVLDATESQLEQQSVNKAPSSEDFEQLKEEVKNQAEQKINEVIEKNETLRQLKNFSDFLKNTGTMAE